jgi:ABC-type transport system substrate-binding protein
MPDCPIRSFVADKIVGFDKHIERTEELLKKTGDVDVNTPVEGLQADPSDPYTFRIRLNQPYPQLRFLMAMHFTSPVPREAVQKYKDEFARHPVGSGEYVMTEYTPKQRIVLQANPNRRPETYPTEGDPGDRRQACSTMRASRCR